MIIVVIGVIIMIIAIVETRIKYPFKDPKEVLGLDILF